MTTNIQPISYFLSQIENPLHWLMLFSLSLLFYFAMSWFIVGKPINGMSGNVISCAIIGASVLDLFGKSEITLESFFHFLFVDVLTTLLVFFLYKKSVDVIRRQGNILEIVKISVKYFWLFLAISIITFMVSYLNVDSASGDSRIVFQNERWYSIVRMYTAFFDPIMSILLFVYIRARRYRLALTLLFFTIAASIVSGSKSGFIITQINALLIYRDLFSITKHEQSAISKIIIFGALVAFLNLLNMNTDITKILIRLGSYGESTIMVYAMPEPTLACENNSMISNLHRGLGRILGDEGSLRFDTLFGIALSNIFYGKDSSTGPNARIGAYVYCAFPGWLIILFASLMTMYILFLWRVFRLLLRSGSFFKTIGTPFFAFSIQSIFDYNVMASSLTALILMGGFLFFRNSCYKIFKT